MLSQVPLPRKEPKDEDYSSDDEEEPVIKMTSVLAAFARQIDLTKIPSDKDSEMTGAVTPPSVDLKLVRDDAVISRLIVKASSKDVVKDLPSSGTTAETAAKSSETNDAKGESSAAPLSRDSDPLGGPVEDSAVESSFEGFVSKGESSTAPLSSDSDPLGGPVEDSAVESSFEGFVSKGESSTAPLSSDSDLLGGPVEDSAVESSFEGFVSCDVQSNAVTPIEVVSDKTESAGAISGPSVQPSADDLQPVGEARGPSELSSDNSESSTALLEMAEKSLVTDAKSSDDKKAASSLESVSNELELCASKEETAVKSLISNLKPDDVSKKKSLELGGSESELKTLKDNSNLCKTIEQTSVRASVIVSKPVVEAEASTEPSSPAPVSSEATAEASSKSPVNSSEPVRVKEEQTEEPTSVENMSDNSRPSGSTEDVFGKSTTIDQESVVIKEEPLEELEPNDNEASAEVVVSSPICELENVLVNEESCEASPQSQAEEEASSDPLASDCGPSGEVPEDPSANNSKLVKEEESSVGTVVPAESTENSTVKSSERLTQWLHTKLSSGKKGKVLILYYFVSSVK